MTSSSILVLGMHRSGTSALTRALSLLGLETGRPGTLMAAAPSNQGGHWEITSLTECNDRLLREAGGRWSGPPASFDAVGSAGGPLGDEARSLARDLLPDAPWAWKDPRLCLTLPFWRSILDQRPAAVVCLRNPLEVAESLERRNGFAVPYGLALWERYLRSMWAALAGQPALVVDYAALLADPSGQVAVVADFMHRWTGVRADDAARAEAAASLDPGQRHHDEVGDAVDRDDRVSPPQRALFRASQAQLGDHAELVELDLGPETPGLQLAFDEHSRMAAHEDEALQLRAWTEQVRAEARADLDRHTLFFHHELERRSAEASMLATDVMAARDQIADLQGALDRIRGRLPIRVYLAARRRLPGGGR